MHFSAASIVAMIFFYATSACVPLKQTTGVDAGAAGTSGSSLKMDIPDPEKFDPKIPKEKRFNAGRLIIEATNDLNPGVDLNTCTKKIDIAKLRSEAKIHETIKNNCGYLITFQLGRLDTTAVTSPTPVATTDPLTRADFKPYYTDSSAVTSAKLKEFAGKSVPVTLKLVRTKYGTDAGYEIGDLQTDSNDTTNVGVDATIKESQYTNDGFITAIGNNFRVGPNGTDGGGISATFQPRDRPASEAITVLFVNSFPINNKPVTTLFSDWIEPSEQAGVSLAARMQQEMLNRLNNYMGAKSLVHVKANIFPNAEYPYVATFIRKLK